jgi:hypothetical protein
MRKAIYGRSTSLKARNTPSKTKSTFFKEGALPPEREKHNSQAHKVFMFQASFGS